MINAMRAYLQTEGQLDYRSCQITYYTYSMFETPNKYRVNVNVHIQSPTSITKKTLNLDSSFEKESEAIKFGIAEGQKFIDENYETGKIAIMQTDEKAKNGTSLKSTSSTSSKQQDAKKKDLR